MTEEGARKSLRVARHAILGDLETVEEVTIYFEGQALKARPGEPVMSALIAAGVTVFRYTKKGSPRRMFCGIGRCTDCVMMVDGVPGVRTCVTEVRDGMKVERQQGVGRWNVEPKADSQKANAPKAGSPDARGEGANHGS